MIFAASVLLLTRLYSVLKRDTSTTLTHRMLRAYCRVSSKYLYFNFLQRYWTIPLLLQKRCNINLDWLDVVIDKMRHVLKIHDTSISRWYFSILILKYKNKTFGIFSFKEIALIKISIKDKKITVSVILEKTYLDMYVCVFMCRDTID